MISVAFAVGDVVVLFVYCSSSSSNSNNNTRAIEGPENLESPGAPKTTSEHTSAKMAVLPRLCELLAASRVDRLAMFTYVDPLDLALN